MRYRSRQPRGTVMVLSIVMSVVITGMIAAMTWVAGEQAQRTGSLDKLDQSFYAAEAGAQRVSWYCRNYQMSSITSPLTGTVNGFNYSVSWSTVTGNTIQITSVGSTGTVSYTLSEKVTPPAMPVAAFSSAGDFDNKNLTITGNVMTGGNYSNGGSGSLTGNLFYAGTAANTGGVGGNVTKDPFESIDFNFLNTVLMANATTMPTFPAIYNFNLVSGTNKVIYVNGNVTDPVITGSGTLYVNGTITFTTTNLTIGSAGSPVNIVATGDIDVQKKATINGSLYAKGNWNRAQVDLTGVVYVAGISPSNNGSSTLTLGTAPWFDPRVPGGVGGLSATTAINNFSGPQP